MPRAVDALALTSSEAGVVACLEGGPSVTAAATRIAGRWISLEDRPEGGRRRRWSSSDLGQLTKLDLGPGEVLAYGVASLDGVVPRLLGPAPFLARRLANKIEFRRIARAVGVATPRHVVIDTSATYAEIVRAVAAPFVLQLPDRSAGAGTYVVSDPRALLMARCQYPEAEMWLASVYRPGPVVNVQVVVASEGVVVHALSVQLTGRTGLAPRMAAYCGTDFGAVRHLEPAAIATVREAAKSLAESLRRLNWRGVVGFDAVVDGAEVQFLEANPRLQASSWLLAEGQRRTAQADIAAAHLAALRGHRIAPAVPVAIDGACMVIRASEPGARLPTAWRVGVYRLEGDRLRWHRPGFGTADLTAGEVFLDGFALPAARVDVEAVIGRASVVESVLAGDGIRLGRLGKRIRLALEAGPLTGPRSGGAFAAADQRG